jgi:hypothetical protein
MASISASELSDARGPSTSPFVLAGSAATADGDGSATARTSAVPEHDQRQRARRGGREQCLSWCVHDVTSSAGANASIVTANCTTPVMR